MPRAPLKSQLGSGAANSHALFFEFSGWLLKAAPRLTDAGDKEDSLGRRMRRAANSLVAALLRGGNYKRRFFCLDGSELRYYRDESCSPASFSGSIDLHTVIDIRWADRSSCPAYAFDLVTDARIFTLAPSPASESAAAEWFNRISHRLESARRRGMTARSLKNKTSASSQLRRMASHRGSVALTSGSGAVGTGAGAIMAGVDAHGAGKGGAAGGGGGGAGGGLAAAAFPLYASHEAAQVTPDGMTSLEPNVTAASAGAAAISSLATALAANSLLSLGASPSAAASALAALAVPTEGAAITPLLSAAVSGAAAGGAMSGHATLAQALAAAAEEATEVGPAPGSAAGSASGGAGSSLDAGSSAGSAASGANGAWPRRGSLIYAPPDFTAPAPRVAEQPRRAKPVVVSLAAASAGGGGFAFAAAGSKRRSSVRFAGGSTPFRAGGSALLYSYPSTTGPAPSPVGGFGATVSGAGSGPAGFLPRGAGVSSGGGGGGGGGPPRRLSRTVSRWEELSGNVPRWALSVANDHRLKHVPLFSPLLGLGPGQAGWSDSAALAVASAPGGLSSLQKKKDKASAADKAAKKKEKKEAKKAKKAAKKASKGKKKGNGGGAGSDSDATSAASAVTGGGSDDDVTDDDDDDDAYGEGDADWDAPPDPLASVGGDPAASFTGVDGDDDVAGFGAGSSSSSMYARPGDSTGVTNGTGYGSDTGAARTTATGTDASDGEGMGSGTDNGSQLSTRPLAASSNRFGTPASPARPISNRRVSAVYGAPLSRNESGTAAAAASSSVSASGASVGAGSDLAADSADAAMKRAAANVRARLAAMSSSSSSGPSSGSASASAGSAAGVGASSAGAASGPSVAAASAASSNQLPGARGTEADLLLALTSVERSHVASMRSQASQAEERLGWRLRRGNGGPAIVPPDVVSSAVSAGASGGWWASALPVLQQAAEASSPSASSNSSSSSVKGVADDGPEPLAPLLALGAAAATALGLASSPSSSASSAALLPSSSFAHERRNSLTSSSSGAAGRPLSTSTTSSSGGLQVRGPIRSNTSSSSKTGGNVSREASSAVLGTSAATSSSLNRGMSDISGINAFAASFKASRHSHTPAAAAAALTGIGALGLPLPLASILHNSNSSGSERSSVASSSSAESAMYAGASRPSSNALSRGLSTASLASQGGLASALGGGGSALPPIDESGAEGASPATSAPSTRNLLPPPGCPLLQPVAAALAAASCPASLLTHSASNRPTRSTGQAARAGRVHTAKVMVHTAKVMGHGGSEDGDDGSEEDEGSSSAGRKRRGASRGAAPRNGPSPLSAHQLKVGREVDGAMERRALQPGPDGSLSSGAAAGGPVTSGPASDARLRRLLASLGRDRSGYGLATASASTAASGSSDEGDADVAGFDAWSDDASAAADDVSGAANVGNSGVVDSWRPGGKALLIADWGWEEERERESVPTGPFLCDAAGLPLAVAFRPTTVPHAHPHSASSPVCPLPPPAPPAAVAASLRTMNRALTVWTGGAHQPSAASAAAWNSGNGNGNGADGRPQSLHFGHHHSQQQPAAPPGTDSPSSPIQGARKPIVSLRPGGRLAFEPVGLSGSGTAAGLPRDGSESTGHVIEAEPSGDHSGRHHISGASSSVSEATAGIAALSLGGTAARSSGGFGSGSPTAPSPIVTHSSGARASRHALALALSGGLTSPPLEIGAEILLPSDVTMTPLLCLGAGYGAVSHAVINGWEDPRRTKGLPYSLPLPPEIAVAVRQRMRGPPGPRANTCGCALTADSDGKNLEGYDRDALSERAPSSPSDLPAFDGSTSISLDPWGDAGTATDDVSADGYEAALAHFKMHVLPAGTVLYRPQAHFAATVSSSSSGSSSSRSKAASDRGDVIGSHPRSLWILLQGRVRVATRPLAPSATSGPSAAAAAAGGLSATEGFLRAWSGLASSLMPGTDSSSASSGNCIVGGGGSSAKSSDDDEGAGLGGGPAPASLVLGGSSGTSCGVASDGSWWVEVTSAASPLVLGAHSVVDGFPHWSTAVLAEGSVVLELQPSAFARLCTSLPSSAAGLALLATASAPHWLATCVPSLVAALADNSPRRGANAANNCGLTPAEKWPLLSSLASTARAVVLAPGQPLFEIGDIGDCAYIVVSGEVAASVPSAPPSSASAYSSSSSSGSDGSGAGWSHTLLAIFGRGSCVGESALVLPGHRSYRAVALTSAVLLRLSHASVRAVLSCRPRVWRAVRHAVTWREPSQLARMPLLAHLVGGEAHSHALAPLADLATPVVLSDSVRPVIAPPAAWTDAQSAAAALASLASSNTAGGSGGSITIGSASAAGAPSLTSRASPWNAIPHTSKRLVGPEARCLFLVASGTAEILPPNAAASSSASSESTSSQQQPQTQQGQQGQRQSVPPGEWLGGATLYTQRHSEELAGLTYGAGQQTAASTGGPGGDSSVAAALGPAAGSFAGTCVLLQLSRHHLDAFVTSLRKGPERLAAWRAGGGAAAAPSSGSGTSSSSAASSASVAAAAAAVGVPTRRTHSRVDALAGVPVAVSSSSSSSAAGSGGSSTVVAGAGGIMLAAAMGGASGGGGAGASVNTYKRNTSAGPPRRSGEGREGREGPPPRRSGGGGGGGGGDAIPPSRGSGGGAGGGQTAYPKSMRFGDNPINSKEGPPRGSRGK